MLQENIFEIRVFFDAAKSTSKQVKTFTFAAFRGIDTRIERMKRISTDIFSDHLSSVLSMFPTNH